MVNMDNKNKDSIVHNHNKKRNSGLIYELLVRYIAKKLVEDNVPAAQSALGILKEHYKKGTLLYKEFRLFNALISTTVSSQSVAESILSEAKKAVQQHDAKALTREKSLLIRSINHTLNDSQFYKQHVQDYKMYATVQTVFNDWKRLNEHNIARVANYEDTIIKWLISDKSAKDQLDNNYDNVSSIVIKTMTERINKKYLNTLNEKQQDLIRTYSLKNENNDELFKNLTNIKIDTLKLISAYNKDHKNDKYLVEKLNKLKETVVSINLDDELKDHDISTFLMLIKLNEEFCLGEKNVQ